MTLSVDQTHMHRAIEIARRGEGYVEPNPMVGCVIANGETVIAEGGFSKVYSGVSRRRRFSSLLSSGSNKKAIKIIPLGVTLSQDEWNENETCAVFPIYK